jgi:hypothetical protein
MLTASCQEPLHHIADAGTRGVLWRVVAHITQQVRVRADDNSFRSFIASILIFLLVNNSLFIFVALLSLLEEGWKM